MTKNEEDWQNKGIMTKNDESRVKIRKSGQKSDKNQSKMMKVG